MPVATASGRAVVMSFVADASANTAAITDAPVMSPRLRDMLRGEFNAVLVAPSSSAEGRNLVAGMERQTGRSGAVCRSVARGVLGQASLPVC